MKGAAEPKWTEEDDDDAFNNGSFITTNPKVWQTRKGKALFEVALAEGLLDHRWQQEFQA